MTRHPVVSLLWLFPAVAAAQPASNTKAAADSLFDEGKRLLAAGDLEHACPKFAASLALLDRLGVRLNLADCHEQQGRTATAWAEFREAASQASTRGDARADFARQRADALTQRLVKLQIKVPKANQVPGLVVRRDETVISGDAFDSPHPVDPGTFTVQATASGCQTWSIRVDVTRIGDVVSVEVPRLASLPATVGATPTPSPTSSVGTPDPRTVERVARKRRHLLGIGVGAGGVVALGAGIALGFKARSKWGTVGTHCDADNVCDAVGVSINRDAHLFGNIGTIVGGFGVVALAAGTVIYATAPSARSVVEHAYLDVGRDSSVQLGFHGDF